jgi:hypothetical protein
MKEERQISMESIAALINPEILQISPLAIPSEGQKQHINLYLQQWQISLGWLIKLEFEDKFKIEGKRNLVNILKPQGEYLRHIFLLCEACHARQAMVDDEALPYANAGEWFAAIYREKMGAGLDEIIRPYPIPDKAITKDKKRDYIRILQNPCSAASKLENPFPIKYFPHHSRLIDTAINLCGKSKEFQRSRYKPFITAWREHLKAKEGRSFKRHEVNEEGDLIITRGRGKNNEVNLSRRTKTLKPSENKGFAS